MHKLKHVLFAIVLGVISLIMNQNQRTVAQSTLARAASTPDVSSTSAVVTREDKPAHPATNPEIEELRRQVQELQERLQKLETLQVANAAPTSNSNARLSGAAPPLTAQSSGTQDP